jgi:hypothetical protein
MPGEHFSRRLAHRSKTFSLAYEDAATLVALSRRSHDGPTATVTGLIPSFRLYTLCPSVKRLSNAFETSSGRRRN